MNRRKTISGLIAALGAGLLGVGLPQAATAAESTLTYAFFAPAKTFPAVQMTHWAQQLAKRTNGKVDVKTFPGGTLLGAKDMYDGVSKGVADIGLGAPSYDPGRFPLTSGIALPVGFLLDPLFDRIGMALLLNDAFAPFFTWVVNTPVVSFSRLNNTIVLGSLVSWLVIFLPSIFLFRFLVARYREHVFARLEKLKLFQAIKASKIYGVYEMFRP